MHKKQRLLKKWKKRYFQSKSSKAETVRHMKKNRHVYDRARRLAHQLDGIPCPPNPLKQIRCRLNRLGNPSKDYNELVGQLTEMVGIIGKIDEVGKTLFEKHHPETNLVGKD